MNETDLILNAYRKLGSIKATHIELGVSEHRIRKVLTAKGIVINDTHQTILDWHEKGKSPEWIAEKVGLSVSVVKSYLPPVRPIYRVDQSPNAVRIAEWRSKKK